MSACSSKRCFPTSAATNARPICIAKRSSNRIACADAFCNLGIIQSQSDNVLKAFDCFTTCLKHDPRHTEAHYNLANLYFDQNDFQLAQLHFQMATELEPEFANAYFNLALVLSINSNAEAASHALAKYRELVPEHEGRDAARLLEDLKKSISIARNSRLNSA